MVGRAIENGKIRKGVWELAGDWVVTGGQSELVTPEQRPKVRSSASLQGGPGLAGKFPPGAFS